MLSTSNQYNIDLIRNVTHGSNALDSSSPTARSSPVILSAAKDLAAARDRPFAALRVTGSISKYLFVSEDEHKRNQQN